MLLIFDWKGREALVCSGKLIVFNGCLVTYYKCVHLYWFSVVLLINYDTGIDGWMPTS